MHRLWILAPLVLALTTGSLVFASELDEIRKEPDLLKRADRAIDYADAALKQARELTVKGESAQAPALIGEVAEACELSLQALRETGKRPGRLSKYYKKGEIRTRDYTRRLEALIQALNYEDRAKAGPFQTRLLAAHEEFLLGAMSK